MTATSQACHFAKDLRVHICTNRYIFEDVHDFSTLWKQRGFLTSSATPYKVEEM